MTIQELCSKYYFHDSCITRIDYHSDSRRLEITMDFCQWAQEWYVEQDPENIWLKLIFSGIEEYDGIIGDVDYFSILDGEVKNDKFWLSILDDFHDEYYEYYLSPSNVEVKVLGVVKD